MSFVRGSVALLRVGLVSWLAAPPEAQAQNLATLAGWSVRGLESVQLSGVQSGSGYFVAEIPALRAPNSTAAVKIAGFAVPGQTGMVIVVSFPSFALADYVPALASTELRNLAITNARLVIAPAGSADLVVTPPAEVGPLVSGPIKASAEPTLTSTADANGSLADLITGLGLNAKSMGVIGPIDPGFFLHPTPVRDLSFNIALPDAAVSGVKLERTVLTVAIRNGRASVALGADATVTVAGHTVSLPGVTIARDTSARVSVSAPLPAAALAALIPIPNVKPGTSPGRELRLTAAIGGAAPSVVVAGDLLVGAKTVGVNLTLASGTGTASLTGSVTLAELSGLSVPGLSELALTNVTLAVAHDTTQLSANLKFRTLDTRVVLFKAGNAAFNVALLPDSMSMANILPIDLNHPLNGIKLTRPAIVIVPPGNPAYRSRPPAAVAEHTGDASEREYTPGANLSAFSASASGAIGRLLDAVKAPSKSDLKLSGSFGLPAFSGTTSAGAALPEFDFGTPPSAISIPAPPGVLTLGGGRLSLSNRGGVQSIAITAPATLTVHGAPLSFTAAITVEDNQGAPSIAVSSTSSTQWHNPLGIDSLTVDSLHVHARFGGRDSLALSGITTLPGISKLKVSASLAFTTEGIADASLSFTGAEIPLSSLPGIRSVPGADQIILRNVVLSPNTIAADGRRKDKTDWLEAVLFRMSAAGAGWNLALLHKNLAIIDMLPGLPAVASTLLANVRLDQAALVLSQSGASGRLSDLAPAARRKLVAIYGDSSASFELKSGLGLVVGFRAASNPSVKPLFDSFGLPGDFVLAGTLGGLFGGPLGLDLRVPTPSVKLPSSVAFLKLPSNVTSHFGVAYSTDKGAEIGVGVGAIFDMQVDGGAHQRIDGTLSFGLTTSGGVTGAISATTLDAWPNALGIKGLTLEPGSKLEFSVSATSEIHATVGAKVKAGQKDVNVTGKLGIIGGVPAKGAVGGYVNEITMADVLALTNAIVGAGGGQPVTTSFPDAHLDSALIAFASPGESLSDFGLTGSGVRVAGRLWLIYQDKPLGRFDGTIDLTGISATGALHDIELPGFLLTGSMLDLYARIEAPPKPPHLKVSGTTKIGGVTSALEMLALKDTLRFKAAQNVQQGDFSYSFAAYLNGPASLSTADLQKVNLSLDATLDLRAIQTYLTGAGAAAVGTFLGGLDSISARLRTERDAAQAIVRQYQDSIARYRAIAQNTRTDQQTSIRNATDAVTRAGAVVASLQRECDAANGAIRPCNQTKSMCSSWDRWLNCTGHTQVADPTARAQCAASNSSYQLLAARKEAEKKLAQGALDAAKSTLQTIQAGLTALPVDVDPRVAPWILLRDGAQVGLSDAQAALDAMSTAPAAIAGARNAAAAVQLQRGHLQGTVQDLTSGRPIILDIEYTLNGRALATRIPFSPTDAAFSYRALELLSVQAMSAVLTATAGAPAALQTAASNHYLAKRAEVDAALAAIGTAVAGPVQQAGSVVQDADSLVARQLAAQKTKLIAQEVQAIQDRIDGLQHTRDALTALLASAPDSAKSLYGARRDSVDQELSRLTRQKDALRGGGDASPQLVLVPGTSASEAAFAPVAVRRNGPESRLDIVWPDRRLLETASDSVRRERIGKRPGRTEAALAFSGPSHRGLVRAARHGSEDLVTSLVDDTGETNGAPPTVIAVTVTAWPSVKVPEAVTVRRICGNASPVTVWVAAMLTVSSSAGDALS